MVDGTKLQNKIRDLVEEAYEELKQESDSYGELRNKCARLINELGYSNGNLGEYVKEIVNKKVEYELANMKIEKKNRGTNTCTP